MLKLYLLIFTLLFLEPTSVAASSQTPKKSIKQNRRPPIKSQIKASEDKDSDRGKGRFLPKRFGVGAGLQSIFLPSIGLEALIALGDLQLAGEIGFFQLSQGEFSGSTSFMGLGARWQLSKNNPFFIGASFGSRKVSLTTNADLNYTDPTSGTTTTTVAWTRKVSQTLFYPKAGRMWTSENSAFIAAAGLMMPIGSKASISGNPPSAQGISDEDYQATADSKLRDVTKTTNSISLGLELKYLRFFN